MKKTALLALLVLWAFGEGEPLAPTPTSGLTAQYGIDGPSFGYRMYDTPSTYLHLSAMYINAAGQSNYNLGLSEGWYLYNLRDKEAILPHAFKTIIRASADNFQYDAEYKINLEFDAALEFGYPQRKGWIYEIGIGYATSYSKIKSEYTQYYSSPLYFGPTGFGSIGYNF